jgi:hypothetical protein
MYPPASAQGAVLFPYHITAAEKSQAFPVRFASGRRFFVKIRLLFKKAITQTVEIVKSLR